MSTFRLSILLCLILLQHSWAQKTFPKHEIQQKSPGVYAILNAQVVDAETGPVKANLLISEGKIQALGANIIVPKEAIVVDGTDLFVYPAFIELDSDYGIKKQEGSGGGRTNFNPQLEPQRKGAYYWNDAIKPEFKASEQFEHDAKRAKELREAGFSMVLSHQRDGIVRGTGLLCLLDEQREVQSVFKPSAARFYSFSRGRSQQSYPSSLMGIIALLRQAHYDAKWYKEGGYKEERNLSLEAWNNQLTLPAIIEPGGDKLNVLRVAELGKEIGIPFIVKGNGDEYQRMEEVKKTGLSLILPLEFPEAYDVSDPLDADYVSLASMKHWELAPHNPRLLNEKGIPFSFTASSNKKLKDFQAALGTAIRKGGLSERAALAALTTQPAKELGMSDLLGRVSKGYLANLLITSGPLFQKDTRILQTWVGGKPFIHEELPAADLRGEYSFQTQGKNYSLIVSGSRLKQEYKLSRKSDSASYTLKPEFLGQQISFQIKDFADSVEKGVYRFQGYYQSRSWNGSLTKPGGGLEKWSAQWEKAYVDTSANKKQEPKSERDTLLGQVIYPFAAYGKPEKPKTESVIFRNATVWTNEEAGILTNTDVWVENGKIKQVGKSLQATGVKEIKAEGLHLSSGIIDEHSHIAISRGVNEGGQMNSAEVRIGDVVNSEDVNIYRQLAGGVIGAQLLHGSANAVGGQSALVKFKWGSAPEEMKIAGVDGFIKFALGENPKNGNSGSFSNSIFPQTRMGIEQLYYDAFARALAYEQQWLEFNKTPEKERAKMIPPRKDLELDAMLEILRKKRFISCHSYVQSEIAMLMKVGDSLGFKVNTFTHILEGYKVANEMKAHGVHASSFADWWAYKWEVKDAIPYNMAILSGAGVTTSVNSDDAEMARRLNQEAAKGVKYGKMSEAEAWKMATLNPAKMLHLDGQTGSIKPGKYADLVLWSDHPLSIYAKPVQTWVEGVRYFDQEEDRRLRESIAQERSRLIQKLLKAKDAGVSVQKPSPPAKKHYHCEDEEDEGQF
jgi:imidazolonepropionase-like amidohydrolase